MLTTDYLVCFTNLGNYAVIPVHKLTENRFKDEGIHLNTLITFASGEKIIKAIAIHQLRSDVYLAFLTRFGQIKRMSVSAIETFKRSRPARCMKLLNGDEIVGVQVLTGNSNLLVITSNGIASLFNENDLTILGSKAGGVKSISGLGKNQATALIAAHEDEKAKVIIITDKGHERVIDVNKVTRTARLGKPQEICPSFKGDPHKVLAAVKVNKEADLMKLNLHLTDNSVYKLVVDDFRLAEAKYAKANIKLPARTFVNYVFDTNIERIDKNTISYPIIEKIKPESVLSISDEPVESLLEEDNAVEESAENIPIEPQKPKEKKEDKSFEQISIFDVDDD